MSILERLGLYATRPDGRARAEIETDIRDELEMHVAERAAAIAATGVTEEDARHQAEALFGSVDTVYARCRATQLGERIMLQRINFAILLLALVALAGVVWRAEQVTTDRDAAFADLQERIASLQDDVRDVPPLQPVLAGTASGQLVRVPMVGQLGSLPRRASPSAKVYVLGKVDRPGSVEWHNRLTLLMALAECGGASEFASLSKVRIIRNKRVVREVNVTEIMRTGKGDIELEKGDRVHVPESFF